MSPIVTKTQKIEHVYSKNFILRKMMLAYYKPIVKREKKLIDENVKKILCIGGGCFPATAILLQKYTNAIITVIDNDISVINVANDVISKYKLEKMIKVINVDGVDIDASTYDLIHIAAQISPKETVLNQVNATKSENAKVIVRVPKKSLKKYYNQFNEKDGKKVKQPFFSNIGNSYLYE